LLDFLLKIVQEDLYANLSDFQLVEFTDSITTDPTPVGSVDTPSVPAVIGNSQTTESSPSESNKIISDVNDKNYVNEIGESFRTEEQKSVDDECAIFVVPSLESIGINLKSYMLTRGSEGVKESLPGSGQPSTPETNVGVVTALGRLGKILPSKSSSQAKLEKREVVEPRSTEEGSQSCLLLSELNIY